MCIFIFYDKMTWNIRVSFHFSWRGIVCYKLIGYATSAARHEVYFCLFIPCNIPSHFLCIKILRTLHCQVNIDDILKMFGKVLRVWPAIISMQSTHTAILFPRWMVLVLDSLESRIMPVISIWVLQLNAVFSRSLQSMLILSEDRKIQMPVEVEKYCLRNLLFDWILD